MSGTTPPAYFDQLYARDGDPWGFETSEYEKEKYRATIAALPRPRFRAGLEIGCSIGVLTRQLADRCDRVTAVDVAESALARARARCADCGVVFQRVAVPAEWPGGTFDLIMLSEVLYFLGPDDIRATAAKAEAALADDGVVVLVNYLGRTDTALDGAAAAELFMAALPALRPLRRLLAPQYRLDLLGRPR